MPSNELLCWLGISISLAHSDHNSGKQSSLDAVQEVYFDTHAQQLWSKEKAKTHNY